MIHLLSLSEIATLEDPIEVYFKRVSDYSIPSPWVAKNKDLCRFQRVNSSYSDLYITLPKDTYISLVNYRGRLNQSTDSNYHFFKIKARHPVLKGLEFKTRAFVYFRMSLDDYNSILFKTDIMRDLKGA